MLSGFGTTGAPLSATPEEQLKAAKDNLNTFVFIGLMERYEDSMLVLKQTFDQGLGQLRSYSISPHAKSSCGCSSSCLVSNCLIIKVSRARRVGNI